MTDRITKCVPKTMAITLVVKCVLFLAITSFVASTNFSIWNFKIYMNEFLDLEYPNFDPKHGFLGNVEAEIISFFQRRQPFAPSAFYVHPNLINRTLRLGSRSMFPLSAL